MALGLSNILQAITGSGAMRPAPQAVTPDPMASNVMQSLGAVQPPAQMLQQPEAPRARRSLVDTIGRIADVFANVGGAQAQYQPYLDAREDRSLAKEDRLRQVDLDALRKQQVEMQLKSGGMAIEGDERSRLGSALGAIAGNPDAASLWPQIAEQLQISPERAAQVGEILSKNPQAAGVFAQSLGWQPEKPQSQSKEVQTYGLLLKEGGPELADAYLQSIANPDSMTPYQQAMLGKAMQSFDFEKWKYLNPQPTEAMRNDAAGLGKGAAGGDDVTARNQTIYNALDAVESSLAPLEEKGFTGAIGGFVPSMFDEESDIFDTNIADLRQSIRGITKLKGDQITEYEAKQIERMLPSRTQTPPGRRKAIANIRSRIDTIVNAAPPKSAARPAAGKPRYQPSPNRKPVPSGGSEAARAEARRRGLIK